MIEGGCERESVMVRVREEQCECVGEKVNVRD